ncbi:MAG TPA: helix-turn-helix domain-containing protein [Pyrinomonadaceae bacterium]|nr:helix-turn-helix domain-containing protein [Pyrinomonadaceae bacterium]
MPEKKYLVDLSISEKLELEKLLKSGKHQTRKLTRARILLLANEGKTDAEIVEVLQTARPTVERTRKRFVEEGLDCLQEKLRHGARPRLDERQQAHLIAVACSPAPEGFARWSLQLLADKAVELGFVDSIAKETIRQMLKKTNSNRG